MYIDFSYIHKTTAVIFCLWLSFYNNTEKCLPKQRHRYVSMFSTPN